MSILASVFGMGVYFAGILKTEWLGIDRYTGRMRIRMDDGYWPQVMMVVLIIGLTPRMGEWVLLFFFCVSAHLLYNLMHGRYPYIDERRQARIYQLVMFDLLALISVGLQIQIIIY